MIRKIICIEFGCGLLQAWHGQEKCVGCGERLVSWAVEGQLREWEAKEKEKEARQKEIPRAA